MKIASTVTSLLFIFTLCLFIGGIFLQIFLSKRSSCWPGLILPGLCLLQSLLALTYLVADGNSIVLLILSTLLYTNIPTLILLGIYYVCRRGMKKKEQIEKMNIQDL